MKVFARLEITPDDLGDDEPLMVERIISSDVDVALWLRRQIDKTEQEHGTSWEADLHLEPLDRVEGDED
jgi:hypothetical protein